MTKKKIKKIVIIGVLIFYIAASVMSYMFSAEKEASRFRDTVRAYADPDYVIELISDFEINNKELIEKSPEEAAEKFMYYYSRSIRYCEYPFSLAVVDSDINVNFVADSFIWITDNDFNNTYVVLEEFLTSEIKKDMGDLKRDVLLDRIIVNEFSVCRSGNKYIPVKLKYTENEQKKEVIFSEYEPTLVFTEKNTMQMNLCFNGDSLPFYNSGYSESMEESINKHIEQNRGNLSSGFIAGYHMNNVEATGSLGVVLMDITDGYQLCFSFRHNTYLAALFSENFFYFNIYLMILFAVAGVIFYIICMKVVRKNEKLEEAKATFISAASHELKTPIAVIQNRCECLMEDVAPEKKDRYLKAIHDEALRMDSIVASLLNYNRITQLTHIEKEKCDLTELLNQEIKSYLAFAQKMGVIFDVSGIERDVCAVCNVGLMKMAIDNYLSNAVKYVQGEKRVTVNLRKKEKGFIFEVINEADEISAADVNEAWQELSKGDKSRQRQGTSIGMGLAICKRIFELHDYKGYSVYKDGKVTFIIEGI